MDILAYHALKIHDDLQRFCVLPRNHPCLKRTKSTGHEAAATNTFHNIMTGQESDPPPILHNDASRARSSRVAINLVSHYAQLQLHLEAEIFQSDFRILITPAIKRICCRGKGTPLASPGEGGLQLAINHRPLAGHR